MAEAVPRKNQLLVSSRDLLCGDLDGWPNRNIDSSTEMQQGWLVIKSETVGIRKRVESNLGLSLVEGPREMVDVDPQNPTVSLAGIEAVSLRQPTLEGAGLALILRSHWTILGLERRSAFAEGAFRRVLNPVPLEVQP